MKSTEKQLQSRGKASCEDIRTLKDMEYSEKLRMLNAPSAGMRSAAAMSLMDIVDTVADHLLQQLARETCLYTRIAICQSLEAGSIKTAEKMGEYLGKIGKNQYKRVEETVSEKKSYPLPRDIIARSMGKMDISVLPVLLSILNGSDRTAISEALDAAGYMLFYHSAAATKELFTMFMGFAEKWKEDQLLMWKLLLCMSAFPDEEALQLLNVYTKRADPLGAQAERSYNILKDRIEKGRL